MEQKLKRLFDYQRFQKNSRLEAMLAEAEGRYAGGLTDETLELVSAAGDDQLLLQGIIEGVDHVGALMVEDLPLEDRL